MALERFVISNTEDCHHVIADSRVCETHLDGKSLSDNVEFNKNSYKSAKISQEELFKLLRDFRSTVMATGTDRLNFDEAILDSHMKIITGLTNSQFDNFADILNLKRSPVWTPRNALGVYLVRLRTGLAFKYQFIILYNDRPLLTRAHGSVQSTKP